MNLTNTKKIILLALLVSQALVLSIVESWIPVPTWVPGIKLGLANIVTLVAIVFFGFRDAMLIMVVRTFLSSVFGGGPLIFLFSIAGGILSTIIMAILYKKFSKTFSYVGISVAGAIMHNVGQLLMASFVMRELAIIKYLPVLLVSGIIMGCFVGFCSSYLIKMLNNSKIFE